eukprot:CCRYP_017142-RA/>CCRYP_017142-RA protein AED:0.20 eAED:0.20 QI:58/1/1/1/0/0/2/110/46
MQSRHFAKWVACESRIMSMTPSPAHGQHRDNTGTRPYYSDVLYLWL